MILSTWVLKKDKIWADGKKMLIKKEKNTDLFKEEGSYEECGDPVKFQRIPRCRLFKHLPLKGINREASY